MGNYIGENVHVCYSTIRSHRHNFFNRIQRIHLIEPHLIMIVDHVPKSIVILMFTTFSVDCNCFKTFRFCLENGIDSSGATDSY